jgi:hypothetical protein
MGGVRDKTEDSSNYERNLLVAGADRWAWTHSASVLTSPQVPEENAKTEFALHKCADYPRDLKDAS